MKVFSTFDIAEVNCSARAHSHTPEQLLAKLIAPSATAVGVLYPQRAVLCCAEWTTIQCNNYNNNAAP